MTWKKNEEQPAALEGAKFTPKHPESAVTKSDLDRIRGQQDHQLRDRGPSNHSSNPSG